MKFCIFLIHKISAAPIHLKNRCQHWCMFYFTKKDIPITGDEYLYHSKYIWSNFSCIQQVACVETCFFIEVTFFLFSIDKFIQIHRHCYVLVPSKYGPEMFSLVQERYVSLQIFTFCRCVLSGTILQMCSLWYSRAVLVLPDTKLFQLEQEVYSSSTEHSMRTL